MEVLKCESAQEEFGVEEDESVIAFYTKKYQKKESKIFKKEEKDDIFIIKEEEKSHGLSLEFDDSDGPIFKLRPESEDDPIYILDGKRVSKIKLKKVKPKTIDQITVYKGKKAIEKYGEDAENGAVVVFLKNSGKTISIFDNANLKTFPNPSTDESTMISFKLEESTQVQIDVVDPVGRMIETLVDEELQAGFHEFSWEKGAERKGTYFLRVQFNQEVKTKQLKLY